MLKKVLVTGANGQLGLTIKELYQDNNINLEFILVSKEELDITNKEALSEFFNSNSFDYCINCAAYTNVEQAEKTPEQAYQVNSEAVKFLANVCRLNKVVLIHVSTDYVFDGEKQEPYTVLDQTNPINEYGKSKLQGEKQIQANLDAYFIVRTSWLYSKKYGKNFYQTILKLAKKEKKLTITTEQKGCPTNTENLAKYIIELIVEKTNDYGLKHFCDKQVMSWFEFAKIILEEHNFTNKIELEGITEFKTYAKRPKYSVLL
ncbi:dTDP-4-dehydrorhamnose reductase [Algibacter amylolyticus]|uniref:dTDP-4-dehydrorhamnose reductase n=1 Tax=Algibacter amylolyticus TaxID=1608400 RepID=A0A5M7BD39_9FLAO|nr:dTDP-4-dehydrorhamnose reductase [Algibacter amylolyticus]KAA5827422.1 dTDP-4-dehydrorhamnose reductase [Algibacter amylolyticus]MBB5266614.1 dTDP-4-dehydrorhamnose reductase [Algibacter amylolyticus]TSJ81667.1 dTDP-4-dehydrorhamnose reductase [Algibacter amylolyticus]